MRQIGSKRIGQVSMATIPMLLLAMSATTNHWKFMCSNTLCVAGMGKRTGLKIFFPMLMYHDMSDLSKLLKSLSCPVTQESHLGGGKRGLFQ
jgi:hypothetical protein